MIIRDPDTIRMAHELAELMGVSVEEAVHAALTERLERVRALQDTPLEDRLLAIAKDSAPRWKEPYRSAEHGDLLYDESGLPF
jgi:antitoxin VapB